MIFKYLKNRKIQRQECLDRIAAVAKKKEEFNNKFPIGENIYYLGKNMTIVNNAYSSYGHTFFELKCKYMKSNDVPETVYISEKLAHALKK